MLLSTLTEGIKLETLIISFGQPPIFFVLDVDEEVDDVSSQPLLPINT